MTDPSHERALAAALERARAAWPEIEIDTGTFADHLHRHCPEGGDPGALAIEDLYLALGCALRDAKALQILHTRLGPGIDRALSRLSLDPGEIDDVREAIVHRLVVDDPPKIADYAGRGSLAQWLSAVAAREALTRKRTAARRRGLLDAAADDLAPDDPELHFLKSHYRVHFRQAFADAVAALAPPDRTMLRHRFVDGLTLDQLARAAGVHRATAARSLARVRQELLDATRLGLHERLGVQPAEIDSVVRLIASNFEVSVQRLLRG